MSTIPALIWIIPSWFARYAVAECIGRLDRLRHVGFIGAWRSPLIVPSVLVS